VLTDVWTAADPIWRESFLLAWESFRVGSVPVGAVLVGPDGVVVSRGRNRFNESAAPPGEIAGSYIAHAEINALATLPPGEYGDHILYSTLEPCLLCSSALRFSHVGTVRFAAEDPFWHGMDRVPDANENIARRWSRREGPQRDGPLRTLGAVLPLISSVERGVRSVITVHEREMPEVLRLAQRLAGEPAARLRTLTLDQAAAEILGIASS
jgi:tRNA(Arg) A34 adenosine deaminase TadA